MGTFFEGEEWSNLTPVALAESDGACAQVAYEAGFAETMGYFRAILRMEEKSARALALTARVIEGNPANYTAWHYRRECLEALGSDLWEELEFVTTAALESPKNYQIWYHRRAIVEKLNDGSQELPFTAQVLEKDSKNYHAWSHRQFVLQHFGLWDGELVYVEKLLKDDLRNNSAWNQRFFVVRKTTGFENAEVRKRELDFAFEYARKAPNNESPFNYIQGIMRLTCFAEIGTVKSFAETFIEELFKKEKEENEEGEAGRGVKADQEAKHPLRFHPPPLLGLLVEIYLRVNEKKQAIAHCENLASKYDTIRRKYWTLKKQNIAGPK